MPKRKWLRFWGLWGVAGFLELPFLQSFFLRPAWLEASPAMILGLHLLASLLMFFVTPKGKGWGYPLRPWGRTLFLLVFLFPFLGWVACGILVASFKPPKKKNVFEEDWKFLPVFETEFFAQKKGGSSRARILKALDFIPLVEILAGEDPDLKRGAIERLAEVRTPEAVAVLLERRKDPSIEVRFYVITALNRIKKEWEDQLEAAKREMERDIYKISARVFLAKVYLQCARSGLLDLMVARSYEDEALHHLKVAVKSEFGSREAFELLRDLCSRREDWIAVLGVLELARKKQKVGEDEFLEKKMDCLYRLGRYAEVAKNMAIRKKMEAPSSKWSVVLDWWNG